MGGRGPANTNNAIHTPYIRPKTLSASARGNLLFEKFSNKSHCVGTTNNQPTTCCVGYRYTHRKRSTSPSHIKMSLPNCRHDSDWLLWIIGGSAADDLDNDNGESNSHQPVPVYKQQHHGDDIQVELEQMGVVMERTGFDRTLLFMTAVNTG